MIKTRLPYFLLFEVLIAMSLVVVLLSTLMGFYVEINRVNLVMEKEQAFSFKKLLLSTRLAAILPQTLGSPKATTAQRMSKNQPGSDFFFYSSLANDPFTKGGTQVLTLLFDNGINLDPEFSYRVLGRLFVNPKDQLCLAMWPSPARWDGINFPPIRHEVLFENVENLHFEFYLPPAKDRKTILSNNPSKGPPAEDPMLVLSAYGEWRTGWLQDYNELPSLIKIILKLKDVPVPMQFIYPLPQSRYIIVYE